MLTLNPNKRISMASALNHPYFNDIPLKNKAIIYP